MNATSSEMKELVDKVREAFREPWLPCVNDDMDDWLEAQGMTTRTEMVSIELQRYDRNQIAQHEALWEAGAGALPEVRKALKGLGKWRTVLLDFLAEFGGSEDDRRALRTIARRRRDPLVDSARTLLRSWGESTEHLVPAQPSGQTPSQRALEDRLAELVDLCRTPTTVRKMMETLGLHDRRNFNRNYVGELHYRRYIEICALSGPLRDSYRATPQGLSWLKQRMRESR